jgi:heme oxygenase (biliverdin-IX-beta and delta-forming)
MKLDPREARQVLRQCGFGALATHSAKLPGYPFVSHVPLALDGAGRPMLLFSRLAEHSRNLEADPRASLMVSVPGDEPQAQPRLTLVGDLQPGEADAPQRERYLRYHPDAEAYLGFGDFRFYRLEVQAVRLVSGFARAGWIAPTEWTPRPLAESEEATLLARLRAHAPAGWQLLGLDWEGLDVRTTGAHRLRHAWGDAPAGADALVEAARAALTTANGA